MRRFGKEWVCTRCLRTDLARSVTPGSIWIEIVLWLAFFIPGLVYSIWRLSQRHDACQFCGSREIVEPDSPRGLALQREVSRIAEPAPVPPTAPKEEEPAEPKVYVIE